jgi:hypothetical protein
MDPVIGVACTVPTMPTAKAVDAKYLIMLFFISFFLSLVGLSALQ